MAKRKKSKGEISGAPSGASMPDMPPRISLSIEGAENGFTVHASGESGGKKSQYTSRNFVAANPASALRIATSHLQSVMGKGKMKKASGRKSASIKRV